MTGKAKPTEVRAMSLNHGQFWVGDDQGNVRRLMMGQIGLGHLRWVKPK